MMNRKLLPNFLWQSKEKNQTSFLCSNNKNHFSKPKLLSTTHKKTQTNKQKTQQTKPKQQILKRNSNQIEKQSHTLHPELRNPIVSFCNTFYYYKNAQVKSK